LLSHPDCSISIEGVGRHPNAFLDAGFRYKKYNTAGKKDDKNIKKGEGTMDEEAVPTNFNNLTEPIN
jgi:hypothetical protein